MIRANHAGSIRTATLHFQNAVYQGGFDSATQSLSKSGLVYFHQHRHLLACQKFDNNLLNGPSFFIHDSTHYQFGEWKGNSPHGVTFYRLQDIVVIASYQNGTIAKGKTILVILQSYNIGVVLELSSGEHWRVKERCQVYCQQQVQRLLLKCKIHHAQAPLSLLKYINKHLNTKDSQMKLRYANGYYRFGFQRGMSVEFDEQERIYAINIDDCQVAHKEQASPVKAGQVYRNSVRSSMEARLKGHVLADPSGKYFDYFKEMLSDMMIKTIVSGFIKDNSAYLERSRQLLNYSREIPVKVDKGPVRSQGESAKMDDSHEKRSDAVLIAEPLQQFSRKKEQYLSNFLRSHQDNEDSLEKAKIKRFRQNIEGTFGQSKTANALSLIEKQLGLDKPTTQPKIILTVDQTPLKHTDNDSLAFPSTTSKKARPKIFDKSQNRRALYEFSPQAGKSKPSTKSRKKIFTAKPKQQESQARAVTSFQVVAQSQQSGSSIANDETPTSPIQVLKSNKDQSRISPQQYRQRTIAYSPSGPVITKAPNDSTIQRKRTLTEYEYQQRSSSIVSEDMSNFPMRINSTMQAHSPPKKMKKQNGIYRDSQSKQGQRQPQNGRAYGNIPYLQRSLKRVKMDRLQAPSNGSKYYKV